LRYRGGVRISPRFAHAAVFAVVRRSLLGLVLLLGSIRVAAFPPAPYYTLYGVVRDHVGTALEVEGAQIVLLRDNAEIGRAPIARTLQGDFNYELDLRIDQNRTATRTYTQKAVPAQGVFSLVVELNGQRFYPIEVSGTLRAGYGGERVRLDLNLGADTDRDGIPDAWEEWQLHQSGRTPGPGGWNLALIDRDGDFDGDGTSNFLEYVAGTFAGDATERLELKLTGKSATHVAFEFFAITGKVYSIEESADLRTWTTATFTLTPGGEAKTLHRAAGVGIQPAHVATVPGESRFYRLTVR
jgi:hypothetical protein